MFPRPQCKYCQEDIVGLRVKCAQCTDFELCLQCFSAGAEIGPHKNDHPYQFKDAGAVGLFIGKNGWTAKEEQHLLDAIEQYGFGNWEDISTHIETRSPEEAKDEYISRFLEGSIGRMSWPHAASCRPKLSDLTQPDDGPLAPEQIAKLPPLDITPEEAAQLGYMPLRDDFEKEYDEAESLVSPLIIHPTEDDDLDIALKLAQVDMYIRRLRERARRKRVCRDYQLVAQFFANTTRKDRPCSKKRASREEKELRDHLRVLTQFHTSQEHERFLANLNRQRELETRISELSRYRRHGITSIEECHHFEMLRQEARNKQDRKSDSSSGDLLPAQALQRKREKGIIFSSSKKAPFGTTSEKSFLDLSPNSRSEGAVAVKRWSSPYGVGGQDSKPGDVANGVAALPISQLLSPEEKLLCASINFTPQQYSSAKYALLEMYLNKSNDKEEALNLKDGDPMKSIFDFLISSGWIPSS